MLIISFVNWLDFCYFQFAREAPCIIEQFKICVSGTNIESSIFISIYLFMESQPALASFKAIIVFMVSSIVPGSRNMVEGFR